LALKWLAKEMDRRYDVLQAEAVRDIESYHKNILAPAKKKHKAGKLKDDEKMPEQMPYIVAFIDELLGFGGKEPFSYFQIGVDDAHKTKIETLINQRIEAKKNKDFAASDKIRDDLIAMGIAIMDTADGTLWEKI